MKAVVLGGYGNFGSRICRALANCPDIELVIAGRDLSQASRFAHALGNRASAMQIDISKPSLAAALKQAGAELVIHTAGPFQQQSYEVPLAVAAADAHYIDLADGRRFVCDFPPALDATFRQRGRIAITGASTVPALSSAVVNHLSQGWQSLGSIDICIAPAQTAPRGIATMAAALDYCGVPIQVWRDGKWLALHGWANPEQVKFARLRPRIGALCDIPDLELFPAHYQGVRHVMFRAALEIGLTQRGLATLAACRRLGIIKHPQKLAKLLNATAGSLDFFGSSLGGMVVRVQGTDAQGMPTRRAWHIAADNDHGPEIPCMPAILLARRLARKETPEVGAHTSMGWLTLTDFAPEFAKWGMMTDVVDEGNTIGQ